MIDLLLLRIMKHRHDYGMLKGLIVEDSLNKETAALLKDFGRYFELFPSHESIDLTTFMTRFPAWHPGVTDERVREFARIMQNAMQEPDEDQRSVVLAELSDNNVMVKLANLIAQFQEGEIPDVLGSINNVIDGYKLSRGIKQIKYIDTPIGELLQDELNDAGVKWRLHCLNESMRGLRGGDFGIIAGRPDKGKTSFIASEVTFMAPQLPPDRNVLWLNNEGPGKRIVPRNYQAALGLTMNEMKEYVRQDLLVDAYRKYMGRLDKVRVVDIHGLNNSQVEMIIEANNPGIIVYDMIDNIGGFGDAARNDLKLEYMYQWARERSVKYDAIGLATSQISSDGDGLRHPTLSMLKDSKTGKQGACDFQLMIGSVNDPNFSMSRWINLPKNKMRRADGKADPAAEVIFDALRSRYKDVPLNPVEG